MTVLFYGSVQKYTSGEKSLDVGGTHSLRTLIGLLGARFGEPFQEFLLADGTCFFLVNGNSIMATGGLKTQLQPADTIEVLPMVEGG